MPMRCLWPSPKTIISKVLTTVVSLAVVAGVLIWCAMIPASSLIPHKPPLTELEKNLDRVPAHISEFSPVSEPLALPKCGNVRPPEALLTPDPVLQGRNDDLNV